MSDKINSIECFDFSLFALWRRFLDEAVPDKPQTETFWFVDTDGNVLDITSRMDGSKSIKCRIDDIPCDIDDVKARALSAFLASNLVLANRPNDSKALASIDGANDLLATAEGKRPARLVSAVDRRDPDMQMIYIPERSLSGDETLSAVSIINMSDQDVAISLPDPIDTQNRIEEVVFPAGESLGNSFLSEDGHLANIPLFAVDPHFLVDVFPEAEPVERDLSR